MSGIKRWFENHVNDYSDEELINSGYSKEEIQLFRESFPKSIKEEKLEES